LGAFGASAFLWPIDSGAQSAFPVIGMLGGGTRSPTLEGFREGLRETGYVEGENVVIEYRWAEGHYDRLPGLAADLVARHVDLIVANGGTPPALAAKAATATIPIVFANAGDPVGTGVVDNLARPSGNITGISILTIELTPKLLDLLVDLVPRAKSVALLVNQINPVGASIITNMQQATGAKGVQLHVINAGTEQEIKQAFAKLDELQADALVVGADPFFFAAREQLVTLTSSRTVPAIYFAREFALAGGLMSYGSSLMAATRQAGVYAGKILRGAKPVELPVEQPTKFELIINLKTAKALGLTVPLSLIARADEVIE
jgi:putative ABC transport system substrate-binding protein